MSRYRKVDLVVSCTKEMAEAFARCQVSSPVMPNIGLPDRQPDPVSKRFEGEALRLLFVGNLVYWKGLELALLALQQMPEQVTLTLVGDGGDRLDVEADIHRLGLNDRVDLRGAVPRVDLLEMYDQFDVFLFPSLHDSGGMAVIEAMCAGLPVVCLDAGGPGISVNNDCGTVVSLGSKDEVVLGLSNAIQNYLDDPVLRERHGRAAVQRVNEAYLWPKNAQKMVQWYEELQR
ncbi:glycosyltransferase family 4 protein [Verrucomicrobiaceae bacterium N1E253]|uniref:Glycosyltransferase family 4 protein n=1 Tax=Oceaniferula marina TaxID=2748318 RepID=A0A851GJ20_9BACT|nr:glycosyltransferase family 4 protein [Oceaniferula marina]NWK55185.1 glycosyltransferase family 4 protein [Oceaniferula marina]